MGLRISTRLRPVHLIVLALLATPIVAGIRIHQWQNDSRVYFLLNDGDAKWIRHFLPFSLNASRNFAPIKTMFRCEFQLHEPADNAHLCVQAFRQFEIWLDTAPGSAKPLFVSPEDLNTWKLRHEIPLPKRLNPGRHHLWIGVTNSGAHPCLLAFSREFRLTTGRNWQTSQDLQHWRSAAFVDDSAREILMGFEQEGYPSVFQSLILIWPFLATIFGLTFARLFWSSSVPQESSAKVGMQLTPSILRWVLLFAWLLMAVNNFWRVIPNWGYDVGDHLAYVKFIVEHQRLPLATDGFQMFQSPLLYLLASPWYVLFSNLFGPQSCVKLLRLLPLCCGMAQIEIAYRVGRRVFPGKNDLQSIVTIVGGFTPMNIYMSQSFGNEPLAACFTSLTIALCFMLMMNPIDNTKPRLLLLGAVWGLALLSKVTPVLLAPLIALVVVLRTGDKNSSWWTLCKNLGLTGLACFSIAGWYYLRNWILLGRPFIGGWDPAIGDPWWQDPSFRTWKQLTSFGISLRQPIFSGVQSFWDATYSTMWADAFFSGYLSRYKENPWNIEWMQVAVWLSLLPTACILSGIFRFSSGELRSARSCLIFAIATIGIYLAAVLDLYMHVPIYCQAKSSYMLGLLPSFAILAAAGAAPLLHFRWSRALFFATLTTWAAANYAAYFCLATV